MCVSTVTAMKTKQEYASKREKHKKILKYGAVMLIIVILSILIFTLLFPPSSPYHPDPNTFYFNAVIVDQLSLTYPNQTFVQTATAILQDGGFTVDYVKGEDAIVDYYKNHLATHDYGIIVLRTHSSSPSPQEVRGDVYIFTSEPYSTQKYVWEQLNDEVARVRYFPEGEAYFGIASRFKMNGKFENTIIIMMGCGGLAGGSNTNLAEVFIYNGAKAFIAWSGDVTASHTDNAVQQLLQHMATERKTIGNALAFIPPDPSTGARLLEYPNSDELNFVIPQKSPTSNFPANEDSEFHISDARICDVNWFSKNRKLSL